MSEQHMKVAVTGTPGTGKTTAVSACEVAIPVIHLNKVLESEGLYTDRDDTRDSLIADIDAIEDWLGDREEYLVESHLAHHCAVDRVIVLRCAPETIIERLLERGEPEATARENAESEALDVILTEAIQRHGQEAVYEIETTDQPVAWVAREIEAVVNGDGEPRSGTVSYESYIQNTLDISGMSDTSIDRDQ